MMVVDAMAQALGIPTTRSLAVVTTGESVFRETILPGAVLARVAASQRRAAATLMRAHNPAVIPRNHRVEAALNVAVQQADFAPLETLLAVLSTPFTVKPEYADYSNPPEPSERVYQTFCGT